MKGKMLNYSDFLNESLLDLLINESFLYFNKDLRDVFSGIADRHEGDSISRLLLDTEFTDTDKDITFLNLIDDKPGYISFTTMKNAIKNATDNYPDVDWLKNMETNVLNDDYLSSIYRNHKNDNKKTNIYIKSRNDIGVGRLINRLFPGKFTDKEIEDFVNRFKAYTDKTGEFELVEGEDIKFYYNRKNYSNQFDGVLGNSCMAHKEYFDLYVNNPDVCKMLILKTGANLILGRALVWKLESFIDTESSEVIEDVWFMDRVYTTVDSDIDRFKSYANDNGWLTRYRNTYNDEMYFTQNGEVIRNHSKIKIKPGPYYPYPYVDTFKYFNGKDGYLYNYNDDKAPMLAKLIETDGSFSKIRGL